MPRISLLLLTPLAQTMSRRYPLQRRGIGNIMVISEFVV